MPLEAHGTSGYAYQHNKALRSEHAMEASKKKSKSQKERAREGPPFSKEVG